MAPLYGLGIIDPYFTTANTTLIYDFDDFVMYAGAADNTVPGDPTSVIVNGATTSSLTVSWTAPAGGVDGGGYVVVRYATSPNADNDPNQNGIYAIGNTITNGTGGLSGTIAYIGTGTSFTDNSLSATTTYYYKVYTVDKAFNYSNEATGNATTAAPAVTSVASGDWNLGTTWSGGNVPTSAQNVIIATGHIVYTNSAITRNASTTVNGSFQLNEGSWATGTNFTYGASGTLIFNNSSGFYDINSTDVFWPSTNGPANVTVDSSITPGSGIRMNTSRTVSGLFQAGNGIRFNTGVTLTINGTCQMNFGGYFDLVSPTYGPNATLVYNTTYGVYYEWTGNATASGVGIPRNVTIQNLQI